MTTNRATEIKPLGNALGKLAATVHEYQRARSMMPTVRPGIVTISWSAGDTPSSDDARVLVAERVTAKWPEIRWEVLAGLLLQITECADEAGVSVAIQEWLGACREADHKDYSEAMEELSDGE